MNIPIKQIVQRLRSFITYNMMLYVNFLLLLALLLDVNLYAVTITFMPILLAYFLVGIGGYFFNDIFDAKADSIALKFNITNILKPWLVWLLIAITWAIGLVLVMKVTTMLALLLSIQFILLFIYSASPFRFKQLGFWGVLIDAAYAHLVPILMLLMHLSDFNKLPWFFMLFPVFTYLIGIRDILIHQLNDFENDAKAGINAFKPSSYLKFPQIINRVEILAALLLVLFIGIAGLSHSLNALTMLFAVALFISYTYVYLIKPNPTNSNTDKLINIYVVVSTIFMSILIVKHERVLCLLLLLHPYVLGFIRSKGQWLWIKVRYCIKVVMGEMFIHYIPLWFNLLLFKIGLIFGRNFKEKPLYQKSKELKVLTWIRKVVG